MFCACMITAFPCEVVVFSPARRASRKLLERIYEFVQTLGMEHRIVTYNQENLRVQPLEPGQATSLCRSFPSKVGVSDSPHPEPFLVFPCCPALIFPFSLSGSVWGSGCRVLFVFIFFTSLTALCAKFQTDIGKAER